MGHWPLYGINISNRGVTVGLGYNLSSISPGCQASFDRVLRHNGWSGWGGEGRPSPIPTAGKLISGRRAAGAQPEVVTAVGELSAQATSQGLRSFHGALQLSPQRQLARRLEAQSPLLCVPTRTCDSGLSNGAHRDRREEQKQRHRKEWNLAADHPGSEWQPLHTQAGRVPLRARQEGTETWPNISGTL